MELRMKYQALGLALILSSVLGAQSKENEAVQRIDTAATVFTEIMAAPDKAIPNELLSRAVCVGIIPGVKKAAFIVGGRYGKGVLVCRTGETTQHWSGPSTVRIEGGSIGAQIGGGETDVVLVVMNERGAQRLMKSEFTIGGDAAVMAGPVGRSAAAQTDAYLTAEILSYSRSRGAFAGVSLQGSTLRSDDADNRAIYGKAVDHAAILQGKVSPPASAAALYDVLNKYAPATTKTSRR